LLLLAVAVPLGVVYWYTRPAQLIPVIEAALKDATGCEASVENASVNTRGEITLEGVTLRVPGAAGDFGVIMTADRVDMVGPARGLLDGSYRPERIELVRPVLHLTEDAMTGMFNYELLTAPPSDGKDSPIPQVRITEGLIRFDQHSPDGMFPLGEMGVEGELSPHNGTPRAYEFVIAETDAPEGIANITFTGGFDLNEPSLDMRAQNFRFEQEQRYFLPTEFRRWWARLAPVGKIPELELSLRPDETGTLHLHEVRMPFVDVGLNLDVLDARNPEQRDIALLLSAIKSRQTRLTGVARIEDNAFTISGTGLAQHNGIGLSPIAYHVTAHGGLAQDAPFSIRLDTEPFTLSPQYQFGLAFNPLTGEGYRLFRPSGEFQLTASFGSAGGDAPATWGLDLNIINGRMTHGMFPLTLEQVSGIVHITPERVDIGPLTARSINGAAVSLQGFAAPASDIAQVELDIDIRGLPVDDALREALGPRTGQNLSRFMNEPAYNARVQRGLIEPGDSENETPQAPRFSLGGTVDVQVPVRRPYGEDVDYSVVPVVDLSGMGLMMTDFPYPLTANAGHITLGPDYVIINDLSVTSPTGGGLTLNGSARRGADGEYRPQIAIENALLPIDELLLSALGSGAEGLLTDLGVGGVLAVQGSVFQAAGATEPDIALDVRLTDGVATPYQGRVQLGEVTGTFNLRSGGLDEMDITGTRGDSTVRVTGDVDWSLPGGGTRADLTFETTNMQWSGELVDVLPPDSDLRSQLTDLYASYEPAGMFDATLNWQPTPGDEPDGFIAQITPHTLAFNLLGGRLDFTDMTGGVTVYTNLLQLNELAGTFNDEDGATGTLQASGDIGFEGKPRIGLSFIGQTSEIGNTARVLLPDTAVSVIDSIQYTGPLGIDSADLTMVAVGGENQTTLFTGDFTLPGIDLVVGGLPITEFVGSLDVEVNAPGAGQPLSMDYDLSSTSLRANDRLVEGFRISANNFTDPAILRTGRGTGSIYGGTVVVEASVDLDRAGGARLQAQLLDTELAPLLKPLEEWPTQSDPRLVNRTLESGLLSATLSLDSSFDPEGPRYGQGEVSLRDAGLLAETPLELFLLQAINFNVPDQRGFDRGGATFDVIGNQVIFDQLWMETRGTEFTVAGRPVLRQGLRITGAGLLTYPEMALDLRLRTVVTGTAQSVPFLSLLGVFRNELLGFQVLGTVKEPEINYRVFRDTRDAWDQLRNPDEE